jgi:hypothetical protein
MKAIYGDDLVGTWRAGIRIKKFPLLEVRD